MPESQTNRPEPSAGQVAAERSAGQAAVPPQGTRQNEATAQGATTQEGAQGGYGDAAYADGGYDSGYGAQASGTTSGYPGGGMLGSVAKMAWGAALVAALGMIAVGIMLLVWPTATLTVVAILIGAALVVTGLLRLFDGAFGHGESGGMRAADIVIGILAIVAGLYCIKHQSVTVLLVALVVGIIWIIHGISDLIVAATSGKVPGRGLRAVTGVFSLAAGLVILFWPGISLVLLLTIMGAWLLFYGVILAVLAFRLRSEAKAATKSTRHPSPARA
ncbi:MAG TPA: HdeD family acid-resistance protein [Streptosporangiaceae bacterium]